MLSIRTLSFPRRRRSFRSSGVTCRCSSRDDDADDDDDSPSHERPSRLNPMGSVDVGPLSSPTVVSPMLALLRCSASDRSCLGKDISFVLRSWSPS